MHHPLLWMNNIPLCWYIIFCLFIRKWMFAIMNSGAMNICGQAFMWHMFQLCLDIYHGGELLCHTVTLCASCFCTLIIIIVVFHVSKYTFISLEKTANDLSTSQRFDGTLMRDPEPEAASCAALQCLSPPQTQSLLHFTSFLTQAKSHSLSHHITHLPTRALT